MLHEVIRHYYLNRSFNIHPNSHRA